MTVTLDNDGQSVGTALSQMDMIVNYMRNCRYNTIDSWLVNSFLNSYANEQILINICLAPFYGTITMNNYCDYDFLLNYFIDNNLIEEEGALSELEYYQDYDTIYLLDNEGRGTVGIIWKYILDTEYRFLTFDPMNNFYEGSLENYLSMYPEFVNYKLVRPQADISDER